METTQINAIRGVDFKTIVKRSDCFKTRWIFKIYYADLINDVKVWRNYPNYISECFKTKKEAVNKLNLKLTTK